MLKLILFINALVFTTLTSVKAAPTVTTPGPVPIISNAAAIAGGLITQPSSNDRLEKLLTDANGNLLTGDALRQLTVFDFNNQKPADGARGGSILLATVDNFPILQDLGISGAISFIEPCGLNIPHLHPRADEVLITIEGILDTGFVMENGFNTEIETQLGKYQGTVFPMGSIHYQQNPTCDPAVFVAALNNEDPGRSDIATSFWMLQSEVINAALGFPTTIGGENIDAWRSHLPVNLAAGVDSCLQACGLLASNSSSSSYA
ncbi:RmlC-like cupin domain-containing protein [Lentinula guzmanii]|uniref:RmlC-like cupin domain-containing protein n=1 Tax=Lentinula guzmanii TaxID=2804957 RepID=A0AA38JMP3_9AGAR|nr:RmlC-like cupin domain-containing protein [Lentinula guzmanii]KAJ3800636.1 RmlC-like cupin domain-containing protein [Lentinula aff. detonsa]